MGDRVHSLVTRRTVPSSPHIKGHIPIVFRRFLKEPLLHFAVLALAIFVAYAAFAPKEAGRPARNIVVSATKIDQIAAIFEKTRQRPPSTEELKALIDDYIAEEALVREALALELDQDDTVIRHRLRQKMEFMSDSEVDAAAPTEADLQAYLDGHTSSYEVDPKFGFTQIYLDPDRHGDLLQADAATLLAKLATNPEIDPAALGDPTLLPPRMEPTEISRIANEFGPDFASALAGFSPGVWAGPAPSAYGLHLVRIDERQPGRLPKLTEVHEAVLRDWSNDQRVRRARAQLDGLLAQYSITIETAQAPAP